MIRYTEGTATDGTTAYWNATPVTKLNDCIVGADYKWTLLAKNSSDADAGQGNVLYKAGGKDVCIGLTPSFAQLTTGRSTTGE